MAAIRFNPVEATYKITDGMPVIELYGRSGEKQVCVQVRDFEPYFWVTGKADVKDSSIARMEEHSKKFLGKEITAKKVFVKLPGDVPAIRDRFESLEADIPFTRRFLIDRKITPLLTYEAEGEYAGSAYKVDVFSAKSISYVGEEIPKLRMLSIDIETHTQMGSEILPEEDPIIMAALYGEGLRKVITWKHFDNKLDYLEVVESEPALLERVKEAIESYKPDIITGYFSDGFDMPYLKARAQKYKVELGLGLDKTGIRTKKGTLPLAEITGISHIDVFRFVKRIFRTSFISFKLNEIAKELLREEKTDVRLERLYEAWKEQNGELEKFAEYNLQDAKLNYMLCEKLLPSIIEFTKIIGLTPSEVSRMSFSQLVEWYLIKEAQQFNELVPNKPGFAQERERRMQSYEGAYVYEPTPGLYGSIAVFDFRSLYPTIISALNISPDTIEYGKDSDDGVLKGMRFGSRKGFISTVIENIIQRRLRIKKLAKESDDKLLEARQQALKTIANSIYGYYGFFGARWYNIDCAKAITAYGRHYITQVISKAKEAGLHVLYSDTDSVFIALNGKKMEEVLKFVEGVNSELPGIMGLEFENIYSSGIFVATKGTETGAKKKYALMDENGKMKIRGFETVRRNLSAIAKETQEKVLQMILSGEGAEKAAEHVKEIVKKLRAKEIPTEKVVIKTQISREIGSYENMPPHVAIAIRMQEKGQKVGAGTTVSYVITEGKGAIRDKAKLPEEVKEGEYDAEYYVANQVMPAVEKILEVVGYESSEFTDAHKQKKLESYFG